MSESDNPYRTPTSALAAHDPTPPPRTGSRPLALWVLLLCYAWYCLLESATVLAVIPRDSLEFAGVVANGLYSLGVGICLWRGVNGVRIWVVLTTVLVLLLLWFMVSRSIWDDNLVMVVACLLRVIAAALLLLPSVRRWFTTRRV